MSRHLSQIFLDALLFFLFHDNALSPSPPAFRYSFSHIIVFDSPRWTVCTYSYCPITSLRLFLPPPLSASNSSNHLFSSFVFSSKLGCLEKRRTEGASRDKYERLPSPSLSYRCSISLKHALPGFPFRFFLSLCAPFFSPDQKPLEAL